MSLKLKYEMTMLFITHDFGVVEDIADDVARNVPRRNC